MKIERWFKRAKVGAKCKNYRLLVHPDMAQVFGEGKANRMRKQSRELGLNIDVVKDEDLPRDRFKVFDLDLKTEVTDVFKSKK